ncbi:hypothetical protein BF29_1913 [Heyndrickxia coagulans DSM 1 = ATCC 7050]|nr:hypothetical protein BF29_1913 [Heyndrickxia coagulans DSM 1 = ATCC 7050]
MKNIHINFWKTDMRKGIDGLYKMNLSFLHQARAPFA